MHSSIPSLYLGFFQGVRPMLTSIVQVLPSESLDHRLREEGGLPDVILAYPGLEIQEHPVWSQSHGFESRQFAPVA